MSGLSGVSRFPRLIVQDVQASGVASGTFTAGDWRVRALNTVALNEISGASLSSNQIYLQAGEYRCRAFAAAWRAGKNKLLVRDVIASANLLIGMNWECGTTDDTSIVANVSGQFTLSSASLVELWHRCDNTSATTGFGVRATLGVSEIYAQVELEKIG